MSTRFSPSSHSRLWEHLNALDDDIVRANANPRVEIYPAANLTFTNGVAEFTFPTPFTQVPWVGITTTSIEHIYAVNEATTTKVVIWGWQNKQGKWLDLPKTIGLVVIGK